MNLEESDETKLNFIQESLIKFIHKECKSGGGDLGASMDMIILSYVLQVLQEEEDSVTVEDFCEMLSGYFPSFTDIPKNEVELWMTQVSRQLRKREQKGSCSSCDEFIMTVFGGTTNPDKTGDSAGQIKGATSTNSTATLTTTEEESRVVPPSQNELLLLEMFPSLQLSEISTVLAYSQNQMEKAVQILLDEEECLRVERRLRRPSKSNQKEIDEKALRDRVVQRYGFVDKDSEGKEFRPELPKEEPKKLVRYREGQVVSTKGERFSEVVVNQETGEETKFKPWISKPNKNH